MKTQLLLIGYFFWFSCKPIIDGQSGLAGRSLTKTVFLCPKLPHFSRVEEKYCLDKTIFIHIFIP